MSRSAYVLLNRLATTTERVLVLMARFVDELPVIFHDSSWTGQAVIDRYDHSPRYEQSETQCAGLYPFESRMLQRYFPSPPAALLAHGVGGGRELLALARKGYRCEAYEPSVALARAAETLVRGHGGGRVQARSVQEWATDATGRFDGVFTGWGMWAHVVHKSDRVAVLQAFRRVCPSGPVLLSFHRWVDTFSHKESPQSGPYAPERYNRMLRITRRHIREKMLGLPPIEPGTGWYSGYFYHLTEEPELRREASEAGYEVAYWEDNPLVYPHAVLVPRQSTP